ncbi:MAG: DUF1540 domain-containing protein [Bacillota bacterium]|jgi:hypothetical protein
MPKVQGNQHIHCSVENCQYYSDGNYCAANEIMVMGDVQGQAYPDTIDHNMASSVPTYNAESCMSTCCKTFVHRGSGKTKADDTYRLPTQS